MKKIIPAIIIFLFSLGTLMAQWDSVGFVEPNISLTSPNVGYYFFNGDEYGNLFRSDDGWDTWNLIHTVGTSEMTGGISQMSFKSDSVGYMLAYIMGFGGLTQTVDRGITWTSIIGCDYDTKYSFPRASFGYLIAWIGSLGGFGLYLYDNGILTRQDSTLPIPVSSMLFINDSVGFIANGGTNVGTYRTTDYGKNWQLSGDSDWVIRKIVFPENSKGFCLTNTSDLYTTSDMGTNWSHLGAIPLMPFSDLFFLDTIHGWAVGKNGQILKTSSGGVSWETVASPTNDDILRIGFFSEYIGYFISVNDYWANKYVLYRTTTGPWGIGEPETFVPVKILQNPASSTLILTTTIPESEVEHLEIVSINGNLVFSLDRFVNEIDIKSLSAGLYLLRYSVKGKVWAEKFIVAD